MRSPGEIVIAGSRYGVEPRFTSSSRLYPLKLTGMVPWLISSTYSSSTLTTPSLFQSWPGRGTNSLIATSGCGGIVGGTVRVGGGRGVRVRVGIGEAVGVTDAAQFGC